MKVQEIVLTGLTLNATVSICSVPDPPAGLVKALALNLTQYYNNKGFGTRPGEAAFDSLLQSFPAPNVSRNGTYISTQTGINYDFPGYTGPGRQDNILCRGQTISAPNDKYFSASVLVSADKEFDTVSGNITYVYSDNTTSVSELRSLPWFAFLTINRGEIVFPYRYTASGKNFNTSHIFEYTSSLNAGKELRSIILPSTTNTMNGRLHIFSISLWKGSSVQVQSIRPTQKWIGNDTQIVEITLNNAGTVCISGRGLKISITAPGVQTMKVGSINRLCPGDQKRVNVGVTGTTNGTVTVILDDGTVKHEQRSSGVEIGLKDYTADLQSLALHESPEWFDNAKYGIFIHWGPYAVTGWGNSTPYESYAEWFWWYSTNRAADSSDFYDYRLRTYGRDWAYDDTFPSYNASKFDPKDWVELFSDAGAKYFVITSKHHDGFANFDTGNTTNRNSLHYGPKRDILKELFDASAKYQPHLRRGTYFSLPEWFNPDFGPYGFAQVPDVGSSTWPGSEARNPYTGKIEPYTGRLPIGDFITDLMVPQMESLAYEYDTDIMWCDCGAANGTAGFAARWWNQVRHSQNRQVALNSRCGLAAAADFDTPEYATFSSAQRRKWESNRGMDPYSYGWNRATPDSAIMSPKDIVHSLVDMVSKNGNLLLDIGPLPDGTIVAAERNNLLEAGKWISAHEEAIFNTTYWFVQTEIANQGIRFTQTEEAFYILFLNKPPVGAKGNTTITINAPVPILDGDVATALGLGGANASDPVLAWTMTSKTGLQVQVPAGLLDKDKYCWVFKVKYM